MVPIQHFKYKVIFKVWRGKNFQDFSVGVSYYYLNILYYYSTTPNCTVHEYMTVYTKQDIILLYY